MKKLAIMFVMLLGSVATIQAQHFNFSCAEVADEGDVTQDTTDVSGDTTYAALVSESGFSTAQLSALETAGWLQSVDANNNANLIKTFNGVEVMYASSDLTFVVDARVSVQAGTFYDRQSGSVDTAYSFRVFITAGQANPRHFFETADETFDFLMNLYPTADEDGFTPTAMSLLEGWSVSSGDNFSASNGVYNILYDARSERYNLNDDGETDLDSFHDSLIEALEAYERHISSNG